MEQIEMHQVTSSNLQAIGYDAESKTLRVEFKNGQRFEYAAVPAALFAELQAAPSKGAYLHGKIVRGGFACRKLEPEPVVEQPSSAGAGEEA